MIKFDKDSRSMCQVTCDMFSIKSKFQQSFWNMYGKHISKFLNKKQADVSNALRRQFQSKLCKFVVIVFNNI